MQCVSIFPISCRIRFTFAALALLLSGVLAQPAAAQIDEVDDLLSGGIEDAGTLINAYLAPGVTGFGAGLNTGWAGAAKPHGVLGFHLRIGATLSRVPNDDRVFSLAAGDLTTLTLANPEIGNSPTIAGDDAVPTYQLQTPSGSAIDMPEGTGFAFAPTPVVEAGVGLVRDTEIMLRLVPPADIGDDYGQISLFGIGAKHGVNQWLPGGALLPVDLTVMAHYTRFGLDADLDENGPDPDAGLDDNGDQSLEWDTNAWAVTALVGKSLPVLSVFAGLGVETSATDVALKGTYDIENEQGIPSSVEDPLTVAFDRNTSLRALAGARLRLGFFALYLEGTLANYSSVTAGVGLSFR
ncbi:MAG: hypothetical protein GVY35_08315 [Bacteroidetes bacterium]|jgi:hypothetical protein|nr:hypothetical protein [Bacteroidota bacterium]